MRRALFAAVVLATLPAHSTYASALDELRAALEHLRAQAPLKARIRQENTSDYKDEGQRRTRQGVAMIVAEDAGAGRPLALVYDAAVLTQAAREPAGRRDSQGPGDAVRDLDAVRVLGLVRSGEHLLEALAGARLVAETAERRAGRPSRAIELALSAPRGLDREKGFKITRTARVWIDASGVPLASEIRTNTEVRRLVFKVRFETTEKNDYAVAGRRLVTRRRETVNHWKAWIIAEGSNRSVTTVEPLE
ncbi:MAG: hypothetical protein ABI610_10275 [Acidobacteriota bacterium]